MADTGGEDAGCDKIRHCYMPHVAYSTPGVGCAPAGRTSGVDAMMPTRGGMWGTE